MNDYKKRVQQAINNFSKRQLKTPRKNNKPEKEVQKQCMTWLNQNNFDVQIFEAKATYDPRRGVYRQQAMTAGVVDCQGSDDQGHSVYIEFKAPGRLYTFNSSKNYRQRTYLKNKISIYAFGCVTDSAERLEEIYSKWRVLFNKNKDEAKEYLIKMLP